MLLAVVLTCGRGNGFGVAEIERARGRRGVGGSTDASPRLLGVISADISSTSASQLRLAIEDATEFDT